jgi:hypothetical protein
LSFILNEVCGQCEMKVLVDAHRRGKFVGKQLSITYVYIIIYDSRSLCIVKGDWNLLKVSFKLMIFNL